MSDEEQQSEPAAGSVPHAYRQRLFWQWVRAMPPRTPSGFVSLLYALGAAADPAGRLRFRDGTPITIKQFAGSVRGDEKQVTTWVDAAIAAGVLTYEGSRRRGATPLYLLVLSPLPDWGAAQSVIKAAADKDKGKPSTKAKKQPPWQAGQGAHWDEEFGGPPPVLEDLENGGPSPELPPPEPDEERGTVPGTRTGDRPPNGSGDGPRNNPGFPRKGSHAMADVGSQPQVARASPPSMADADPPARPVQAVFLLNLPGGAQGPEPDTPPPDFARCEACHGRLIPRPGRTTHHQHCQPETSDRDRDTG